MIDNKYTERRKQNFIKELRQSVGMSQKELLARIEKETQGEMRIPQSQMSDIENSRKNCDMEKAAVICKIFNCRIENVLNVEYLDNTVPSEDVLINLNMFTTQQLNSLHDAIVAELKRRGEY